LRDSIEIYKELKVPIKSIRLGGGGARSPLWRQIQADVYGQNVEIVESDEGAAYGAALLAGVGTGAWESIDDACAATIRVAETFLPNAKTSKVMEIQYGAYQSVYPSLKSIMKTLNDTAS
jgi:xylulokinase